MEWSKQGNLENEIPKNYSILYTYIYSVNAKNKEKIVLHSLHSVPHCIQLKQRR